MKNISLINCGTINLLNDMQLSFSGVYKNDSFQSVQYEYNDMLNFNVTYR